LAQAVSPDWPPVVFKYPRRRADGESPLFRLADEA
jgi:hypothetical protein